MGQRLAFELLAVEGIRNSWPALEAVSKIGVWSKVKAGQGYKYEEYS